MQSKENSLSDKYYDHYHKYFGSPSGRLSCVFDEKIGIVQALYYNRAVRGCFVISTVGMSKCKNEIGALCEVICIVDDSYEIYAKALLMTIQHIYSRRLQFGWGCAERGLAPFFKSSGLTASEMDGFYFCNIFSLPSQFASVQVGGGQVGSVYSAVPITEKEYDYWCKYGSEKFENLLEENGVDTASVGRKSLIT
jgi:hypothetical protein